MSDAWVVLGALAVRTDVQFLPPPVQEPRIPVWVSAMTRNERTLGRAAQWDGVLLGAMIAEGGMDIRPPEAVAEVAARPDAPADIVAAAPAGTDPALYEDAGATWVLITDWLDVLRGVASAPAPKSRSWVAATARSVELQVHPLPRRQTGIRR